MNELIKVDADAQVVSARELHEALGVEKRIRTGKGQVYFVNKFLGRGE